MRCTVRRLQKSFMSLILPAAVLLLPGCRKGTEQTVRGVELTVIPRWDAAAFDKQLIYLNGLGQRVQVQQLKFYLSDMRLIGGGSDTLFDADIFTVTDGPVVRRYAYDGSGSPTSVRFGLGLSPDLNMTDISQVPVNDPLGNNHGMYWSWATMYRFLIFDGRFDNDVSSTAPLPFQFSIHTGLDTLFREVELALSTPGNVDDTLRLGLVVDVSRFFSDGTEVLDLSQGSQWHGTVADIDLGIRAADLQSRSFHTEWQ